MFPFPSIKESIGPLLKDSRLGRPSVLGGDKPHMGSWEQWLECKKHLKSLELLAFVVWWQWVHNSLVGA